MIRLRAGALALAFLAGSMAAPQVSEAQIFVGVSVRLAPPALPVYLQPPLPGPDYIWTPGYWAWDPDAADYFWVPGTWVLAPQPGYLWTPGYWGWNDGAYVFHEGYWGPHIGYYGGIAYGFGYTGVGFAGGYWNGGHYFYNTSVNNVRNVNVTNVYNQTVVVNRTGLANASFNGPGGATAQPTAQQLTAAREPHLGATPAQTQHLAAAHAVPTAFAAANHGAPPIAATPAPGRFSGPGVARAAIVPAPAGDLSGGRSGGGRGPGAGGSVRAGEAPLEGSTQAFAHARPAGADQPFNGQPAAAVRAGAPPAHAAPPPRPQKPPPPHPEAHPAHDDHPRR